MIISRCGCVTSCSRGHSVSKYLPVTRRKRKLVTVGAFVLLFSLVAVQASPQEISARTGTKTEISVQEFESPMVLNVPMPKVLDLERNESQAVGKGLRQFVCDDVSIFRLEIKRGKTMKAKPGKPAIAELFFEGFVRVRPSHDRLVKLTFMFIKGEEKVFTTSAARFEAEEKQNTEFQKRFLIPLLRLESLFEGETEPKLEVVIDVVDD